MPGSGSEDYPYISSFQNVQILLGNFLYDRQSENPLPKKELFNGGKWEWGLSPLDKVIDSPEKLEKLLGAPGIYRYVE